MKKSVLKAVRANLIKNAIIEGRSSLDLCADFVATETIEDPAIYKVRGWLMDALEARHPEAFEAWIESGDSDPTAYIKASIDHADYNREADIAPWSINC